MKKTIQLAMIGTILAMGLLHAKAQTTNTNLVLSVNIALTGFLQTTEDTNAATVEPVRITTRNVIDAFGTATTTTFSPRARLLAINTLGAPDGPRFVIRDAGVDTDVSNFLAVDSFGSVRRFQTAASGRTTGIEYSILQVEFSAGQQNFFVEGFSTMSTGSLLHRNTIIQQDVTKSVQGTVAGTGQWNARDGTPRPGVFRGSARATGGRLEFEEVP
jgi:hypothetical protein